MTDRFAPLEPSPPAESSVPAGVAFAPVVSTISTPPPPVIVAARKKEDRAFRILLAVGLLVAVGGVTFAIGRVTAPAAATTRGGFAANGGFANGGAGAGGAGTGGAGLGRGAGFGGGVLVTGTVDSVSGSTMTLKEANGTAVTVNLADTTTYHAQAAATAADVTVGKQVQVLVEIGGGFGGGGFPGASGAPRASPAAGGNGQGGTDAATRTFTAIDVTLVTP
jgi:hypothetical protein